MLCAAACLFGGSMFKKKIGRGGYSILYTSSPLYVYNGRKKLPYVPVSVKTFYLE